MIGFPLLALVVIATQAAATVEDLAIQPRTPLILDYPKKCALGASFLETVILDFDVSASGNPENIRITESSNSCFNKGATKAVENWGFWMQAPSDGVIKRTDISITLEFDRLKTPTKREQKIRRSVRRQLDRVRANLSSNKDPHVELERLTAINGKYGDKFSLAEIALFRLLCAIADADTGDYSSALSDLRHAQKTGMLDQSDQNVAAAIAALESKIANNLASDQ